ncbi:MAG: GAF domain-containing sensor histidine kinase [Anaerolineae bacterium]|nr:GAF domain-containing sensor histidine kinase [Anaerolineae bacterium]
MSIECFLYGLTAFAMGLVVLLRGRRSSQLALGKQFWWLGAFGLLTSFYAWGSIFLVDNNPFALSADVTAAVRIVLLVASGIALLRFGAGLILNADPLPPWLALVSNTLLIPVTLVIAYAIIAVATAANHELSAAQWVRYLVIFPANVLAAIGFVLQWKRLRHTPYTPLMLAATGGAFLLNAFFTGAVTGTVGLTDAMIASVTQVPVSVWRVGTMALVALLVSGSMSVFEVERKQEIARLQAARQQAQNTARAIRATSQHESEIWLDALVKISRRIANMEDADAVLSELVALARELVRADYAALALNEMGTRLCLKYVASASGVEIPRNADITNAIVRRTVETGLARRFPEDGSGVDFTWQVAGQPIVTPTAAIVPLKLNQTTIGALWTGRSSPTSFSCVDLIGLSHLANQAVITLEHVSMAGRLQSLAVMEERSRIAREMHDSLAQILGYLSLETQTLEALTRQHDEAAVLIELAQARETIRSAQADVRENILSLRTTLSGDAGFVTALTQYVEEFGIQTGIQTCVQPAEEVALTPLAEAQAVRIVQEALTNVRKHAKAAHVRVTMKADTSWLTISVIDDGVGMPERPPTDHHFGLQTMHERAEGIGGALRFKSSPGMGTTVELRLPLATEGG